MRRIALFLFAMMVCLNVFAAQDKFVKEQKAVDTLMSTWHEDFSNNNNVKAFLDATSDDVIFHGTDPNEYFTKDQMREWLQKNTASDFKATKRLIHFSKRGDVAWVDEELSSPAYWSSRAMTILEKDNNGKWKIYFYSVLFTIPNAAVPEIRPIIYK